MPFLAKMASQRSRSQDPWQPRGKPDKPQCESLTQLRRTFNELDLNNRVVKASVMDIRGNFMAEGSYGHIHCPFRQPRPRRSDARGSPFAKSTMDFEGVANSPFAGLTSPEKWRSSRGSRLDDEGTETKEDGALMEQEDDARVASEDAGVEESSPGSSGGGREMLQSIDS